MTPGTTLTRIGQDVFGCDAAGLSRRWKGVIGVTSVELSKLILRMGIDVDSVFPEDLALPPEDLRRKLRTSEAGIYGRSASVRLFLAATGFAGPSAQLQLKQVKRRASAFTAHPDETGPGQTILYSGDTVRFVCFAPHDGRLILLDYASDGHDVRLLSPHERDAWAQTGAEGTITVPDPIDPPLTVRAMGGNRHVTALWLAAPFAQGFDINPAMWTQDAGENDAPVPEFRALSAVAITAIVKALQNDPDGPVLAADTLTYRVQS